MVRETREAISQELLDEIDKSEGMPLSALARRLPGTRQGKPVSLSCVLRWVLDGATVEKGPRARKVRLEAVRIAGKWISTPGALRRFILAQQPGYTAPIRSPSQRSRAAERAKRELDKAGF